MLIFSLFSLCLSFLLVFVEINCSLGHFDYLGFIVYGNGNPQSEPKKKG